MILKQFATDILFIIFYNNKNISLKINLTSVQKNDDSLYEMEDFEMF